MCLPAGLLPWDAKHPQPHVEPFTSKKGLSVIDSGFGAAWPKSAPISHHPELQIPLMVHTVMCVSLLRDGLGRRGSRRVLPIVSMVENPMFPFGGPQRDSYWWWVENNFSSFSLVCEKWKDASWRHCQVQAYALQRILTFFSASGDIKPQTLNSLSVPNCQVADGAVSPRVCLEKAANAWKGKTVFYSNELPEFIEYVIKRPCWDQNHFTFLKRDTLGLGLRPGNSLDQRQERRIQK